EELLKQEDKIKVSQLFREDFEVTTPETRIVEVAAMMIFKDIRRVFVTSDGNLVGGTTTEAPGGGHPLAKEAVLYLFDWPTRKVVWQAVPVPGAGSISSLEIGSDGHVYGIANGCKLFVFDVKKREVIHEADLAEFGGITRPGMVRAPEGSIYATMSKGVVRLTPGTFAHELIATAPQAMSAGPALLNGRLYYASNAHLWSVALETPK
ncbi:MAG: hypothetical protein KKI08_03585, partial [Armatimonadetes bacterium]|nr:hypothetical protein [Armatimonadota bacterium]